MIYEVGDLAHLTVVFANLAGTPTDTTVSLLVQAPDGTQQTYSGGINHDGLGAYSYNLAITLAGQYKYRWQGTGAVLAVQEGSITVAPTAIAPTQSLDLTTVAIVKAWISGTGQAAVSTADDVNIQKCITANGAYWLWRTGQISGNGTLPAVSPFIKPLAYDEWYDGNGNERMFLKTFPTTSVELLEIDGVVIPASSGFKSRGYVIDSDGRSLVMRGSVNRFMGSRGAYAVTQPASIGFNYGVQNVHVQRHGGFNGVPPDVQEASTRMVATNYKRRTYIDQESVSLTMGGGTTRFRDWVTEPYVEQVIQHYSRSSFA